jgi:hypothetical protein
MAQMEQHDVIYTSVGYLGWSNQMKPISDTDWLKTALHLVKLIVTQLIKKTPTFYRNQHFIIVFTRTHYRSLSWAECISIFHWLRCSKEFCVTFHSKVVFYSEELSAPRPNPRLEDHPLWAICDWLFNIFVVTLHIWRSSPQSATWRHAMLW